MKSHQISALIGSAKWMFLLGIFQKLTTFTMNQLLISHVGPKLFGKVAVQFELLLSTLLFLSREGIRLAIVRETISDDHDRKLMINLSWIPTYCVALVIFGLVALKSIALIDWDVNILYIYCSGVFLECLSEPFFNSYQNNFELHVKIRAEGFATLMKSFVAFLSVSRLSMSIYSFGIAQVVYGATYFLIMLIHVKWSQIRIEDGQPLRYSFFLPEPCFHVRSVMNGNISAVGRRMCITAYHAFFSSILKHVLTESDKIVLLIFTTAHHQGLYAVASNYGSLVARLIFLPVEESARLAFAKAASSLHSTARVDDLCGELDQLLSILINLLALVAAIGIIFPVFGVAYVSVFVQFALGSQWRSAEMESALQVYCLYIFCLAINGITEAFVQSITPSSSFRRLNTGLVVSSGAFLLSFLSACYYSNEASPLPWFSRLQMGRVGISGVIAANIASMTARILYNGYWIEQVFADPSILQVAGQRHGNEDRRESAPFLSFSRRLGPPWRSLTALSAAAITCWLSNWTYSQSKRQARDAMLHISVGGVAGLAVVATYLFDLPRSDIATLLDWVRGKTGSRKEKDI